jgi:hypothetical protein
MGKQSLVEKLNISIVFELGSFHWFCDKISKIFCSLLTSRLFYYRFVKVSPDRGGFMFFVKQLLYLFVFHFIFKWLLLRKEILKEMIALELLENLLGTYLTGMILFSPTKCCFFSSNFNGEEFCFSFLSDVVTCGEWEYRDV